MSEEVFTYTTRVVEFGRAWWWATTQVHGGKPGVTFKSRGGAEKFVSVGQDLIFPNMQAGTDGLLRVLACGAMGETYLVDHHGGVVQFPGRRGGAHYAFGLGDTVLLQDDGSGKMSVWKFDGTRVMDVPAVGAPVPRTVDVPYSAEGFWSTGPDGLPLTVPRGVKVVEGVELSNLQESGDCSLGTASVGLLGGVVLVDRVTKIKRMWPVYSPIAPALEVLAGSPYVSLSCGTHYATVCPEPDEFPHIPYDPLPSPAVDGERRPVWLSAVRGGGAQPPGHLHWSYTDGAKPHVEGGPDAWRDFFAGHPPAVLIGSYSTNVKKECEELTPWPSDWPAPPESEIRRRDDKGIWLGSMLELAQRSGAVLICYRDQNRVATDPWDQNPDINVPEIRYPEIEYVQSLRALGVDACIGHQGYPVIERGLCLSAMDAMYRTETWGLQIYQAKNIPVALWVPIFTGNNDAYPMAEISRLFHFQTVLADRYTCVRFVFGFAWDRHGGGDVHPWLWEAWRRRCAQTATPADRLPVVRGWTAPVVAEPVPEPTTPVGPPVPPHDGGHDHTTAAVASAAAAAAAVSAVALAIALKRKRAGDRLTAVEQAMVSDAQRRMAAREKMAEPGREAR